MIRNIKASMGRFDNLLYRLNYHLRNLHQRQAFDLKAIPVIINNYNRLECLQSQLDWIKRVGLRNVFIIDNASEYPPLLKFYKQTDCTVLALDKNVGFEALWKTVIFQRFRNSYYIYTDPDIVPDEACSFDAIEHFYRLLQEYPQVDKVGFGLVIDDLPEHYPLKEKVVNWEQKFWQTKVEENVYEAPIDTTFALYRPGAKGGSELRALRTGGKYVARHTSWYTNPEAMTAEERHYAAKANRSGSWTAELMGKQRNIFY